LLTLWMRIKKRQRRYLRVKQRGYMQSSLTELMLGYHCEVAEATGMRVFHADGETTKHK